MYELVSGRFPFCGGTPAKLMLQHLSEVPVHISALRPDIPRWAGDLIMQLLEKKLDDRPECAAEVLDLISAGKRRSKDPRSSSASTWIKITSRSRRTRRSDAEEASPEENGGEEISSATQYYSAGLGRNILKAAVALLLAAMITAFWLLALTF